MEQNENKEHKPLKRGDLTRHAMEALLGNKDKEWTDEKLDEFKEIERLYDDLGRFMGMAVMNWMLEKSDELKIIDKNFPMSLMLSSAIYACYTISALEHLRPEGCEDADPYDVFMEIMPIAKSVVDGDIFDRIKDGLEEMKKKNG